MPYARRVGAVVIGLKVILATYGSSNLEPAVWAISDRMRHVGVKDFLGAAGRGLIFLDGPGDRFCIWRQLWIGLNVHERRGIDTESCRRRRKSNVQRLGCGAAAARQQQT